MKKYCICPGYVTSKNDGKRHYVNASRLMKLYGVSPAYCVTLHNEMDIRTTGEGLILLRPDYSGEYKLPERKEPK